MRRASALALLLLGFGCDRAPGALPQATDAASTADATPRIVSTVMEDASSADFEPYPCADPTSVCLLRLHECRDTISHLNESACLKIADACLKKSKTDVMALGLVCNPLQPTARCANPDFTCEHIWSIGCGFGHNPACSGTLASLSADSCLFLGYTNHVSDIVRAGIVCNR